MKLERHLNTAVNDTVRAEDRMAHDELEQPSSIARSVGSEPVRVNRWGRWVFVVALLVVAAAVTFPRWGGPLGDLARRVQVGRADAEEAESARVQALAAAARWRNVAGALSTGEPAGETSTADEALARGKRQLAAMEYAGAAESFGQAAELYESQTAMLQPTLRDQPSQLAEATRKVLAELDKLEQEIYGRVAELGERVAACKRNVRTARNAEERAAIEARKASAEKELDLLNRLKSLAQVNAFSVSQRAGITAELAQGDRQLEAGDYQAALASYRGAKADAERLLVWPRKAESALRKQATLLQEIEQVRSVLGPAAMDSAGVQAALADLAAGEQGGSAELAAGRAAEAAALFESAGARLREIKDRALAELLSLARAHHGEGKNSAAVRALDELLALMPDHAAGQELRQEILAHRVTNSIGAELAFIPPGTFTMGSPTHEFGRDDDERLHTVEIARGFYMGVTEVTQSQWMAVMGGNPSAWKGADLPVEQVSWEEVMEFCRKLSLAEERSYRLPTEEEWEYACRAGTTTPFHFGETISTDQANYDGDLVYGGGQKGVFRNETVAVRTFPPNAWGLYDMHGNVWEWCPDSIKEYPLDTVRNAGDEPRVEGRVLRGGSWRNRPKFCRCANRVRDTEGSRLNNIGFRVVLESE